MKALFISASALVVLALAPPPADARTICTLVADAADGTILIEQGDCRTGVTPASTFKVPLAVMGFDAGILKDAQSPRIQYTQGDPDWGGVDWTQPATPARWLKYSVLWYSWHVTRTLGPERFAAYVDAFSYGNRDVSGDPGGGNALERAWIASSLTISPIEQAVFFRKLVNRQLPVAPRAMEQTIAIVDSMAAGDGWTIHGKTGSAYPRRKDGSFDRARGWGWFVGWASDGDRTLVFARLDQDEQRQRRSGGLRARAAFLEAWPELARAIPQR